MRLNWGWRKWVGRRDEKGASDDGIDGHRGGEEGGIKNENG